MTTCELVNYSNPELEAMLAFGEITEEEYLSMLDEQQSNNVVVYVLWNPARDTFEEDF